LNERIIELFPEASINSNSRRGVRLPVSGFLSKVGDEINLPDPEAR
jgi:hypothetical protein